MLKISQLSDILSITKPCMPTISRFYGIVIRFRTEEGSHNVPHIHVKHNGKECSVSIETGEIFAGTLSNRAHKLVLEWLNLHKAELLNMWNTKQFTKIPGLE